MAVSVEEPDGQRELHWPATLTPARCGTSPRSPPPWPMGTLTKKVIVDVRGEILELKNTLNVMVDQLNSFASEVTARVARRSGDGGALGRTGLRPRRRSASGRT